MECLKSCCRKLLRRKLKEQETQVIAMTMPPGDAEGRRGVADDYLLSKLPSDGRDVPFVLPSFKASYVQPDVPDVPSRPLGSARCTYAARKAELLGSSQFIYSPESSFHRGPVAPFLSPGSARRDTMMSRTAGPLGPGGSVKRSDQQRLSSSMFDLSAPHGHKQRLDSMSSALSSSTSSMMDSVESSLDSITLSGDERDLGKVCVRLSYQEALEQVWITLVGCSDLHLPVDVTEQQRIGFKAVLTVPKAVHFKSTVRPYSQDVSFMETFVFALRLQQLRCSALVLRLQTHQPKRRTAAECVLSLRSLDPWEAEHWLDLCPPSKSSVCHSELHLSTCFQPVSGRIQLQVLAAHNLPASSSPLTQAFFVKVEMLQPGRAVLKKKTRALKASAGQCQWAETLHFLLEPLDHACSLLVKLYSRSSVRQKRCLGQVQLGLDSPVPDAVAQWKDAMSHPEKVVSSWHRLSSSSSS